MEEVLEYAVSSSLSEMQMADAKEDAACRKKPPEQKRFFLLLLDDIVAPHGASHSDRASSERCTVQRGNRITHIKTLHRNLGLHYIYITLRIMYRA